VVGDVREQHKGSVFSPSPLPLFPSPSEQVTVYNRKSTWKGSSQKALPLTQETPLYSWPALIIFLSFKPLPSSCFFLFLFLPLFFFIHTPTLVRGGARGGVFTRGTSYCSCSFFCFCFIVFWVRLLPSLPPRFSVLFCVLQLFLYSLSWSSLVSSPLCFFFVYYLLCSQRFSFVVSFTYSPVYWCEVVGVAPGCLGACYYYSFFFFLGYQWCVFSEGIDLSESLQKKKKESLSL
jgi:hypothetical protein